MSARKVDVYDKQILLGLMQGENYADIANRVHIPRTLVEQRTNRIRDLTQSSTTIAAIAKIVVGSSSYEEATDRFMEKYGVH